MNFNHLYYFHVIAQEGSLARAAKRLHLSQPTLSTQLKQLEQYFEVKLFDRASGVLRLNANGRRALEITQDIFRMAQRLEDMFPAERPPMKSRLEIGIATTVARSFALDRFVELFRNEEILARVRQGDHEYLLHELVGNGLDLLITDSLPDQRNDRGTEFRVLSSPEFVIIAGEDLALELTEESADGLHHQPFIHYTSHSSYRFVIDQFFRDRQVEPRVVAEADDVHVIRDAVVAGVGIGVVPRTVAGPPGQGVKILGRLDRTFEIYALYSRHDPSEEVLAALDILSGPAGGQVEDPAEAAE